MDARLVIALLACLSVATGASAVECRGETHAGLRFTTCRVDSAREDLRLFHSAGGVPYRGFARLEAALAGEGRTLVFAMNAGMFEPDLAPVGLLVIDGREVAPIDRSHSWGNFYQQPNGVFLVDAAGPRVISTDEYRARPTFATQSGPMLLHHGKLPVNMAMRSTSRHVRNGVCVPAAHSVAFVISEDAVTFREFAEYFSAVLGCRDALYFDGSVSSLHSRQLGRSDQRSPLGPIVAVVERTLPAVTP